MFRHFCIHVNNFIEVKKYFVSTIRMGFQILIISIKYQRLYKGVFIIKIKIQCK